MCMMKFEFNFVHLCNAYLDFKLLILVYSQEVRPETVFLFKFINVFDRSNMSFCV